MVRVPWWWPVPWWWSESSHRSSVGCGSPRVVVPWCVWSQGLLLYPPSLGLLKGCRKRAKVIGSFSSLLVEIAPCLCNAHCVENNIGHSLRGFLVYDRVRLLIWMAKEQLRLELFVDAPSGPLSERRIFIIVVDILGCVGDTENCEPIESSANTVQVCSR